MTDRGKAPTAPKRASVVLAMTLNELKIYGRDLRLFVMLVMLPLLLLLMIGAGLAPDLAARARQVELQVTGKHVPDAVKALRKAGFHAYRADAPPSDRPFSRSRATLRTGDGRFDLKVADSDIPIGDVLRAQIAVALVGQSDTFKQRTALASESAAKRVRTPYDVALPGLTIAFGFYLTAILASNLARESIWGTWPRLVAAPIDRFSLIAGKLAIHAAFFAAQLWLMVGIGRLLWSTGLDMGFDAIARITLVGLAAGVCAVGLGLLVASRAQNIAAIGQLSSIAVFVPAGVGGAFIALAYLPEWVRRVAPMSPMYWAVNEVRSALYGAHDWGLTLERVGVLTAFGLVLLVLGIRQVTWSDLKFDT